MNKINHINILQIGKLPPPIGGITVHIERLYKNLISSNIRCKILHTSYNSKLFSNNPDIVWIFNIVRIRKLLKYRCVIHLHVSALNKLLWIFLIIILLSKQRKIITIHSGSFGKDIYKINSIKKQLHKTLLSKFDAIITVNIHQKKYITEELGMLNKNIIVIPAFIPTIYSLKAPNNNVLNDFVINSEQILLSSGTTHKFRGYELVLDFLERNHKYNGLFVFYSAGEKDYRENVIKRIDKLPNATYVENLTPDEFSWVLSKVNIYVRNTDRDGDSVAIREAAHFKKKIVASDAVVRPNGVQLFKYNDVDSFANAINNAIEMDKGYITENFDNLKAIQDIYYSVWTK